MPSGFFVLLRYYLRVDDVLIRINDTRLYYEKENGYILREFTSKESKAKDLKVFFLFLILQFCWKLKLQNWKFRCRGSFGATPTKYRNTSNWSVRPLRNWNFKICRVYLCLFVNEEVFD